MKSLAADPTRSTETWWNRPCGGRDVLAVAFPLIVSTAFWSVQWFVDRMFLMWYSTEAMSASLPAGMMHWTMLCLPMGVASYCNAFVAQYYGAERYGRIGRAVGQGEIFGWIMTPIFLISIPLASYLFTFSELSQSGLDYFRWMAPGAGAVVLSNAMSSYYTGRGLTWTVMRVNVFGTLVNIVLDYMLVFGVAGLPELGIKGAALATVIANWSNVLIFGWLMSRDENREKFGLAGRLRFDYELAKRMVIYGIPSALPMAVEACAFSLMTMFVYRLGATEAAATGLAFNVNAVAFIPVFGISIAVTTLVGQQLGAGNPKLAARATWTAQVIALCYTGVFAIAYISIPDFFLLAHESGAKDAAEFEEVRALTVILLRFVACYCWFDALQTVFVGALKGAGDTRFVLFTVTIVSGAAVSIGAFGQFKLGWNIFGWWWVLAFWLFTLSAVYCTRFIQGKWQSMRIIEAEPEAVELP
ncbi:MATE efflux family protein [Pirellula staleyi DSM 6068]|uniref:Multidrug-efflux transporter n=1 Tax=Pirellula staleyi (strain ATCC 27377 / DSM 6068 / ICPB 4128) TaxID=530564 RepID=D2R4S6_PIRSD|nr:MATE family efflux transporter [Pirellula staleyi]ADB17142.1 MATE efflux family protein [Pirellula staleyi DSM 6068]